MTTTPQIVDEAEGYLRQLAAALARPRENECLCCYVARMLDEFDCDGSHRHALCYRDARAPRATALITRLGQIGACCCDCELFLNGYELRSSSQDSLDDRFADGDTFFAPDSLPRCEGVRSGSVQPCTNWVRIRRW
jgi:hypothetical protein